MSFFNLEIKDRRTVLITKLRENKKGSGEEKDFLNKIIAIKMWHLYILFLTFEINARFNKLYKNTPIIYILYKCVNVYFIYSHILCIYRNQLFELKEKVHTLRVFLPVTLYFT